MGVLAKKYEIVQQAKAEARKQVLEEEAIKRDVSRLIARRNTTSGGAMDAAAVQALQNLKLRELQERRQQEDAADEAAWTAGILEDGAGAAHQVRLTD